MRESENRNKRLEGRGGIEGHVDGQLKRLRLKGKRWGGGERHANRCGQTNVMSISVICVYSSARETLTCTAHLVNSKARLTHCAVRRPIQMLPTRSRRS